MKLVRYTGSSDWSALYVDGKLDTVGDHYLIDERISQLAGVEDYHDDYDDFLQGGNQYCDAAKTLEEVQAYRQQREDREAQAAELEAQAAALEAQAAALRRSI